MVKLILPCAHNWKWMSTGPTTSQESWHCTKCGAWETRYPDAASPADQVEDARDAALWRKFLRIHRYYRWEKFDGPDEIIETVRDTTEDAAMSATPPEGGA